MKKTLGPDALIRNPFQESLPFSNKFYGAFIARVSHEEFYPPHYHLAIEIILTIKMGGELLVNGKRFALAEGQVYYIAPNAVHAFRYAPKKGGEVHVVHLNSSHWCKVISRFKRCSFNNAMNRLLQIPVLHPFQKDKLAGTIEGLSRIQEELRDGKDGRDGILNSVRDMELLFRLFSILLDAEIQPGAGKENDERVRRILDAVGSLSDRPVSLNEIARNCSMSKYHLCRVFKTGTGTTVKAYLNQARVHHALRLMTEKSKNVTEACYECGFSSLSYFIQVFAKYMGRTPKQWLLDEKRK